MGARREVKALPVVLTFLAVIVTAINLRAGIASVGPVLGEILGSFGADSTVAGIITAMPGVFFAVFGLLAVPIARRLGVGNTLLLGAAMTFGGLLVRPFVSSINFFWG